MNKRPLVVMLDSYAIIHRAYHALPGLATTSGKPTGAIYGFLMILSGILDKFKPDHVIAAFDRAEKTFRHEAFDDYKGTRGKTDDDLIVQIDEIRTMCARIGLPLIDSSGFEADDILGTLAMQLKDTCDIIIASGDMDTMQLITGNTVRVYTQRKGLKDVVLYGENEVIERYGFGPSSIPDYKALRGDPSDNIPGIRGIGEKTATELIVKYGNLETIYENIDSLPVTDRIRGLIRDGREDAEFSLVLATIRTDAPVVYDINSPHFDQVCNHDELSAICNELEFRGMADKFKRAVSGKGSVQNVSSTGTAKRVAPVKEKVEVTAEELPEDQLRRLQIMRWVLDSRNIHESSVDIFAATKSKNSDEAERVLIDQLRDAGLLELWNDLEQPLMQVVDEMKVNGIVIDRNVLQTIGSQLVTDIAQLEAKIYEYTGAININSPKQLGDALYDTLELKPKRIKKTAGGARSTKEDELQKMRELHPVIDMILDYRERQKLLNTYIEPLGQLVGDDGRIHPILWQDGTATGRFSSEKPNIQNMPIRTELGKTIRNVFVAPDGYVLVKMDYSQIELRITALLSGDTFMQSVFREKRDIHTEVAARVFHVHHDQVTSEMRRRAKIINFGIIYGMGITALQKNLESTRAEAEVFYNAYFEQFPTISEYFDRVMQTAARQGYTTTLWGRRRYFADIKSKLPFLRAAAERMAMNAPIQGTAADVMKFGMIDAARVLAKFPGNKMIAQVHDELLFEIKREDLEAIVPQLQSALENVLHKHSSHADSVPLAVEVATGPSWGTMIQMK